MEFYPSGNQVYVNIHRQSLFNCRLRVLKNTYKENIVTVRHKSWYEM